MRIALLVIALGLGAPRFSNPDAQEAFAEAQGHFQAKEYGDAAKALEKVYALEPDPSLLFAWGQALRLDGNCEQALELYEAFLDSGEEKGADLAQKHVEGCREEVAASRKAQEEAKADAEAQAQREREREARRLAEEERAAELEREQTAAAVAEAEAKRKPWIADPVGGSLAGAGVVSLGLGVGFAVAGSSALRRADRADVHDDYVHEIGRARTRQTVSAVTFSLGGALLVAAAVRYGLVARRQKRTSASIWLGPRGAGLSVSGHF